MASPQPVEIVGWGPDVSEALDRVESLANVALGAAVIGVALLLLGVYGLLMLGMRR